MRTLVTGGHGFLAPVVAAHLRDHDHDVTILTSSAATDPLLGEVEVVRADLRDRAELRGALHEPFDAVAHLAGLGDVHRCRIEPLPYFDVNTAGTLNLLMALHDLGGGIRPVWVLASTQTVYGNDHTVPMTETLPVQPPHPYAASKLAAEQILLGHAATGAVGAAVLRLVNLAGAAGSHGDPSARGIVPKALVAAATGETFPVNGDGSTVRDYVHVNDVADAVCRAIVVTEPGDHEVYNIGSGDGTSILDVLRAAEATTGRTIAVEHRPAVAEPPFLVVDNRRACDALSWNPTRSTIDVIVADAWSAMRMS